LWFVRFVGFVFVFLSCLVKFQAWVETSNAYLLHWFTDLLLLLVVFVVVDDDERPEKK